MIGIYKIENKVNGKIYVGQSNDIEYRWQCHKSELRNNNHHNNHLQKAWEKYGEENFKFELIEQCLIGELDEKEMFWIEKLETFNKDKGYNLTLGGKGQRLISDKTIKDICDLYNTKKYTTTEIGEIFGLDSKGVRRCLYYGNELGMCDYDSRYSSFISHAEKVICLNNLKIFNSVDMAEKFYNVNGITACCRGKLRYVGIDKDGEYLLWMYLDEYNTYSKEEIEQYKNNLFSILHKKDVVCLNTKQIFKNTRLACDWCGLRQLRSIQLCCTGKAKYAGAHPITKEKLAWAYYMDYITMSEDDIENLIKRANTDPCVKEVICLNNLTIFSTPVEAQKWCNSDSEKIKKCCRGDANNAGIDPDTHELLTWMYLEDYKNSNTVYINNKLFLKEYTYTNPDRMKSLICLNDLSVFKSMKDAGKWCGLKNPSAIGEYLYGKKKSAGKHPITGEKLRWMYYDDYLKLNKNTYKEETTS